MKGKKLALCYVSFLFIIACFALLVLFAASPEPKDSAQFLLSLASGLAAIILFGVMSAMDPQPEEESEKTRLARLGIRYALFALLASLIQLTLPSLVQGFAPDLYTMLGADNMQFLTIILSVDVFGFGALFLSTKRIEKTAIEKKSMGFGKLLLFFLMTIGLAGVGAIVGYVVNNLVTAPGSAGGGGALNNLMMNSGMGMRVLTVGILAPIFEELVFRKLLVDRLVKYGEFVAIATSGICFGLFHGNFSQSFFTAMVGCLWAFVYVRTGNILNTILLHMAVNLTTSIITISLATKMAAYDLTEMTDTSQIYALMETNPEAVTAVGMFGLWLIFLCLLALIGLIIFIVFFAQKKFRLKRLENEPTKLQTLGLMFSSTYMWLFYLICIGLFAIVYLPGWLK